MIVRSVIVVFMIFSVCLMVGASSADTGRDLEEIRLSVEKSSLSQGRKAMLLGKATDAVKSGVPSADVAVIVKRGLSRGGDGKIIEDAFDIVIRTKANGLPVRPVLDRIEQGLSKGVASERISGSARLLASKLAAADAIVNNVSRSGLKIERQAEKGDAVHTVARALEKAIPEDEITRVGMKAAKKGASLSRFDASVNAMTAFIEMGMPLDNASRMIHKVIDKGFSEADMIRMEREMAGRLRDGAGMDEVMRGMESMIDSGRMGEWHRGMGSGSMHGPASGMGGSSTLHNSPGMGSHHGTGGPGMGGHRH